MNNQSQWFSNGINNIVEDFFLEPKNQITELEKNDIELTIESYIDQILNPKRRTGKDQKDAWEKGWGEIAREYQDTKSLSSFCLNLVYLF